MKLIRDNNYTTIDFEGLDKNYVKHFENALGQYTGVRVPGYEKTREFRAGLWDGYTRVYDSNLHRIADGLYPQVTRFLKEAQKLSASITYTVEDNRDEPFMNVEDMDEEHTFISHGKELTLKDYQEEAVESAIDNSRGILDLAVNSGKCISVDDYLLTANKGYVKLSSILDELNVSPNDTNERDISIRYPLINRYGKVEYASFLTVNGKKTTYEITTTRGNNMHITGNNPVLVYTPEKGQHWVRADELRPGDVLVSLNTESIFGNTSISQDEAYLIGLIIAEGGYSKSGLTVTTGKQKLVDFISRLLEKKYQDTPRVRHDKRSKAIEVVFHKKSYENIFNKYSLKRGTSESKEIPDAIMHSNRATILAFLAGYLESDGYWSKTAASFELTTKSPTLAKQLVLLLNQLGVQGTTRLKFVETKKGTQKYYRVSVNGVSSVNLTKYLEKYALAHTDEFYDFTSREGKEKSLPMSNNVIRLLVGDLKLLGVKTTVFKSFLKDNNDISRTRLTSIVSKIPYSKLDELPSYQRVMELADHNYHYDVLDDITVYKTEPTFDFVMPETHSLINSGFIIHNTAVSVSIIKELQKFLERGETVAYFVPSVTIFTQAIETFQENFGKENVGYIGNQKRKLSKINVITLSSMGSALKNPVDSSAVKVTGKLKILQTFSEEVFPFFSEQKNDRMILKSLISNYPPSSKARRTIIEWLKEAEQACLTDNRVRQFVNSKNAEYISSLDPKKNIKYKKYLKTLEFVDTVRVIIVDEGHHSGGDVSYNTLLSFPNAQYKFAMTGSYDPDKQLQTQRMRGLFGDVIARQRNEAMISRGVSADPTIHIVKIRGELNLNKKDGEDKDYLTVVKKGIVQNEDRNNVITQVIKRMDDRKTPSLVIVGRVEHGEILSRMLDELGVKNKFLSGSTSSDERQEYLKKFEEGEIGVLLSTTIFDEGLSLNKFKALFMVSSTRSPRLVIQRIGRVLRKKEDNTAYVFDFFDETNFFLKSQADARMRIYEKEKFKVKFLN